MNSKVKIILVYGILYIITFSSSYIENKSYFPIGILTINSIIFLTFIKFLNIEKKVVTKFLLIIMVLFIPLIIDNDYFVSAYMQNTANLIFPDIILVLCNIFTIPFIYIFDLLIKLNIIKVSFIIVPTYIFILNYINKKLL